MSGPPDPLSTLRVGRVARESVLEAQQAENTSISR